jgi:hypothetical protein
VARPSSSRVIAAEAIASFDTKTGGTYRVAIAASTDYRRQLPASVPNPLAPGDERSMCGPHQSDAVLTPVADGKLARLRSSPDMAWQRIVL